MSDRRCAIRATTDIMPIIKIIYSREKNMLMITTSLIYIIKMVNSIKIFICKVNYLYKI